MEQVKVATWPDVDALLSLLSQQGHFCLGLLEWMSLLGLASMLKEVDAIPSILVAGRFSESNVLFPAWFHAWNATEACLCSKFNTSFTKAVKARSCLPAGTSGYNGNAS